MHNSGNMLMAQQFQTCCATVNCRPINSDYVTTKAAYSLSRCAAEYFVLWADISRSLGFQALPTSFGVVRSAPKRSLADSSDESVPTEIHRSFRREPVVVHARRSPSNGRRGAAGSWLVSEPAGQVGGRARRHSLWTSQPSTTSTNAMIPVG